MNIISLLIFRIVFAFHLSTYKIYALHGVYNRQSRIPFSKILSKFQSSFPFSQTILKNNIQSDEPFDFNYLKKLNERCERLSSLESEYMLSFWSEPLHSFQITPNIDSKRVSITSTCNSLSTILNNPNHWQSYAIWDTTPTLNSNQICLSKTIESIMNAEWSGDTFQTPMIILTLCNFNSFDKIMKNVN